MEPHVEKAPIRINNPYICAIFLVMGGIAMGFGLVFSSFTLVPITNEFKLSNSESIWFNVIGIFAASIGSVGIYPLVNKFGKRVCLFGCAIYSSIVWCLLGASVNKYMAFTFRILSGTTCGLYSTIVPTYLSEVAPEKHRFLFGFINQIGCATGFLLVTVLGASVTWRQTSYICSVPSMILVLTSLFIPEKECATSNTTLGDLFKYKKENFVAFIFMFFLQFSGISAVLSNIETIIKSANLTISTSLIGILTNVTQLVATCLSAFVVDKLGNRVCWMIAAVMQLISFILLCVHQKCNLPSAVFMVALFIEQIGYGIGTGPIPFAAAAELFPLEVRATGMAFGTGENWILAALVNLIWPYLQDALTLGYAFLFFAGIQVLAIIFGIFELKPKSAQYEENSSNSGELAVVSEL